MRFIYYYKTSDNVRHEAEISAPSRDEAFTALRERGIRPIKVVEDGKWRMENRKRKRVKLTVWIACALTIIISALLSFSTPQVPYQNVPQATKDGPRRFAIESNVVELPTEGARMALPRPRRFIPELAGSSACTSCLKRASERLLARFAMPGEPLVADLPLVTDEMTRDLYESLGNGIIVEPGDSAAVAELKGIVTRLKDEAEVYLGTGRGLSDYIGYLKQRQRMEVRYREDIMRDYSMEEAADMLRMMGFRQPQEEVESN